MSATIFLPAFFPMSTISRASALLSSRLFINDPLPVLTSRTMQSSSAASFFPIMLAAISGILSTVAVTSRNAYSFLSAGANCLLCPTIANPISFTCRIKSSSESVVRKPVIASSLSTVPPVCPNPLPLILATLTPRDATTGATTRLVLSPTPPVECLSTRIPFTAEKFTFSPESRTANVKSHVSRTLMPRK